MIGMLVTYQLIGYLLTLSGLWLSCRGSICCVNGLINPRLMCRRATALSLSVCVPALQAPTLVYAVQVWHQQLPNHNYNYPMITYTHPVTGNLPTKTLIAKQQPTNICVPLHRGFGTLFCLVFSVVAKIPRSVIRREIPRLVAIVLMLVLILVLSPPAHPGPLSAF